MVVELVAGFLFFVVASYAGTRLALWHHDGGRFADTWLSDWTTPNHDEYIVDDSKKESSDARDRSERDR
ncbi:hypothetical protein [Natronobacterium texcoconense]|uniref:Uncharacterized protein n=1 Tax=Natronobacterium texcoconense TaxID=1095778 RepID=A0A1H1GLX5_NATTX|nr:hypothetical protein [Natronobacterium texcoconense]SDR14212.1 hypothetical protein SAMN04489842_2497 [Natronobacterium texcoconense]